MDQGPRQPAEIVLTDLKTPRQCCKSQVCRPLGGHFWKVNLQKSSEICPQMDAVGPLIWTQKKFARFMRLSVGICANLPDIEELPLYMP